ncbi:hypothetical protein HELRODRAFT_165101 [Helobdella robusta]|uniref:Uncharacterized protein n=1 Tax=Helobdella robusta TaxID=6412 RepID=T1EWA7_HELRO|nr:hypothetical protein HELRODRAFT_165101 [Helobdella robusta]ESN92957.1 hypothetical protein HELRODRAFT_165101 [Helobdella robusta]
MNLYSPHHHKRYQQGYSHSSKTFNNHRPMLGQRSIESRISSEFEDQFPHEHNRGNDNSRFVSGVGCSTSQRTSSLMAYSPSDLNEAVQNISAMNISSINVSAGKTPTNYFPSSSDDFVGASVMNVGGIDCGDDGDDEDERNELFLPSSCGDVGMKSFDSHVDQIVNDKQADSNDDDEDENDDDVILISETCVDEDEDSDDGNHNGDDVINKNDVDDKDDDQPVGDGEDFNDVHFENWT